MERSVTPIPLHKMRRSTEPSEVQVERTAEPLDPGPPVERARPASGRQAFQLAAWREAHTRWPYAALLMLGVLMGTLLPGELGHYADVGVVWLVPILAVVMGAGDHARREAFWRGLGGPPAARASGRMVTDLLLLAVPGAFSTLRLVLEHADELGLRLGVLALLLYALTSSMRLAFASVLARIAAAFGVLGLALAATALSLELRVWSLVEALEWRLWALMAVGLVASLLLERRLGPLGAGMRKRGRAPLVVGVAAALLGPAVVEAAWMSPEDGSLVVVAASGQRALLQPKVTGEAEDMLFHGGRLWMWEDGELRRLPITDAEDATLGPDGAVAWRTFQDPFAPVYSQQDGHVLTPDGRELECPDVHSLDPVHQSSAGCLAFAEVWGSSPTRELRLEDGSVRTYDYDGISELRPDGSLFEHDMPYLMDFSW